MEVFIWNMSISCQLLFILLSTVIFLFLKDRTFKFYALYNGFLLLYLLTRDDVTYQTIRRLLVANLGESNAKRFLYISILYIQVLFYNFYTIFSLYFLDLDKSSKIFFRQVRHLVRLTNIIFLIFGIIIFISGFTRVYLYIYLFAYVPGLLILFFITLSKALKYTGDHRHFLLTGVSAFAVCAVTSLLGSYIPALEMESPISYFYTGIVLETIFFSLGLCYKIKLINDEKNRVRREISIAKHRRQLSKLHGLLEGEEKERKRIAAELHDGVAGDLSALKYTLSVLSNENAADKKEILITDLKQIIDKANIQLREISHNLSPSTLENQGFIEALKIFVRQKEKVYGLPIHFKVEGEEFILSRSTEMHLYRIVQELVTNVIKHSGATKAAVLINASKEKLNITVKDDGTGFSELKNHGGIGLSNIDSRIRFLGAAFRKDISDAGSSFTITVNLTNKN